MRFAAPQSALVVLAAWLALAGPAAAGKPGSFQPFDRSGFVGGAEEQEPSPPVPPGEGLAALAPASGCGAVACGKDWEGGLFGGDDVCCTVLPSGLLWHVPLANQREPRMTVNFNTALDDGLITDTAIGAEFGLVRLSGANPKQGVQLDMMAVVFTRLDGAILYAADYRFGVPVTFACGPWSGKVSYEHSSYHVGDEFIENNPGVRLKSYTRDELVFGVAYEFLDDFRAYAQFGYAFGKRRPPNGGTRYDVGLEWVRNRGVGPWGQPYAAVDLDIRSEHDFEPNLTVQVGWVYRNEDNGRGFRVALEYYDGRSPYGKFFGRDEDWVGLTINYDW